MPWQPININPCEIFLSKYILYWKCYVGGKFHWNWKRCANDLIHIFSGFPTKHSPGYFLCENKFTTSLMELAPVGMPGPYIHLSAPEELQHPKQPNRRHNTVHLRPRIVCVTAVGAKLEKITSVVTSAITKDCGLVCGPLK